MRKGRWNRQNLWTDDVAVQLLENQYKDRKDQRFDWVGDHDDEDAWDSTDKWTEVRDHVGNANNEADQHRIRHAQCAASDKAQHTDDSGVQNLTGDKSAEDSVAVVGEV